MTIHLVTPPIFANCGGSRSTSWAIPKSCFGDLIDLGPPANAGDSTEGPTSSNPSSRKQDRVREGFQHPCRCYESPVPSAAPIFSTEKNRSDCTSSARPTTTIFGVTPSLVPKVQPSRGGPRIGGIEAGGRSDGGIGEWGEEESSDCARGER